MKLRTGSGFRRAASAPDGRPCVRRPLTADRHLRGQRLRDRRRQANPRKAAVASHSESPSELSNLPSAVHEAAATQCLSMPKLAPSGAVSAVQGSRSPAASTVDPAASLQRAVFAPPIAYTIHSIPAHLLDMSNWPVFDERILGALDDDDPAKIRFIRLKDGIKIYLEREGLKRAATAAAVSEASFLRLLRKCLRVNLVTGEIWGFAAIVGDSRGGTYRRSADANDQPPANAGPGAFHALLRHYPDILNALVRAIEGKGKRGQQRISHQTFKEVHKAFLNACATCGIGEQSYPRNTANQAFQSVKRFVVEYLRGHPESFTLWFGQGSDLQLRVGTGEKDFQLAEQPFDLVQVDAHRVDVIGTIAVQTPHGPKRVVVRRLWIVVLYCWESTAVLGYSLCFEEQVSAETIERAFLSAMTPWKPRTLFQGLRYHEGAGLPFGSIVGLHGCPAVMIQWDNFSSHYAEAIAGRVRKSLGCHFVYGAIGRWFTNAALERHFRTLESSGLRRLMSNVGSGAHDPLRAEDPGRSAVADVIDMRLIEDELEVFFTGYNAGPSAARSGQRPLEIIRNRMRLKGPNFNTWMPRLPAPPSGLAPRIGWEYRQVRVAGAMKAGAVKRPYFEAWGRRYSAPDLSTRFDLIGKHLHAFFRITDSLAEAAFEDGTPLRKLNLLGNREAHRMPLHLLKELYRSKNATYVPEEVALERVAASLADRAQADAQDCPYNVSDAASEIAQLRRDFEAAGTPPPDSIAPPARPQRSTGSAAATAIFGPTAPADPPQTVPTPSARRPGVQPAPMPRYRAPGQATPSFSRLGSRPS